MINDPASTRHLIEVNQRMIAGGRRSYYPGVTSLSMSIGDTEPTMTLIVPKVHLVFICINVDDEPNLAGVFLQKENAEKYTEDNPLNVGFNYVVEEWEVSDYEPPANSLIDSMPEFNLDLLPGDGYIVEDLILNINKQEQNVENVTPST